MKDLFDDRLALKLTEEEDPRELPPLLAADPWIASSLLHKAIRRGETRIAQAAALRFFSLRRSAIWRRLMVIAFEDIGAGSADTVAAVVAAGTDAQARLAAGGDTRVILAVVRMMADAAKDRGADYLISAVRLHPDLEQARELAGGSSLDQRLYLVADKSLPLATRAVAAWFASGVESPGEHRLGPGDLPALMEVYRNLGVPEPLVAATRMAIARTREPICLMVPLLWLAAFEGEMPAIRDCIVPASPTIRDIPMYALDFHTRIGKAAVGQFARDNPDVRACLEAQLPDYRIHRAACLGAFFTDASPIARRLDWPGSSALQTLGIEADMLQAGVPREGIAPILGVFRDNLDHLNAIRAQCFLQKLNPKQRAAILGASTGPTWG